MSDGDEGAADGRVGRGQSKRAQRGRGGRGGLRDEVPGAAERTSSRTSEHAGWARARAFFPLSSNWLPCACCTYLATFWLLFLFFMPKVFSAACRHANTASAPPRPTCHAATHTFAEAALWFCLPPLGGIMVSWSHPIRPVRLPTKLNSLTLPIKSS